MRVTVVDASALAAVLFDEPEAAPIVASVTGALIAPTLIRYELASVCTVKTIRHPDRGQEIGARYRLFDSLALDLYEPDWDDLPTLARRWQLSAYDVAYLQLALTRKAALVTLDAAAGGSLGSCLGGRMSTARGNFSNLFYDDFKTKPPQARLFAC